MPVVSLLVCVGGGEVEDVVVAGAGRPDVELVLLGREQPRLLLQRGLRLEEAAHVLLAAPGTQFNKKKIWFEFFLEKWLDIPF